MRLKLDKFKVSESDIFEPLQTICVLNDGDLFLLNMKNYLTENREKLDFEKLIFEISGKLNNKIIQQDYDMFQIERKEMKKGNEDESMNLVEKKSLHNNLKRLSNMRMPFRIGRK